MLQDYAEKALRFAAQEGAQYCDVRAEVNTTKGFLLENGQVEHFLSSLEVGLGIRVLADGAWGFYSMSNPSSIEELKDAALEAVKSARYCAKTKKDKITLAEIRPCTDKIDYAIIEKPTLESMMGIALDCDKVLRSRKRITLSSIVMQYDEIHKYFVNSDGSNIVQNYGDTVINLSATAHESGLTETVSSTEGGRGGLDLLKGKTDVMKKADYISEKADCLLDAKTAKEEKATVVMNPDFVALLSHEILGHPSEADRVSGKEMAWAGGSWWEGKMGTKVGSSELNVIDDPTIPTSLGWYKYDDEGVISTRKKLIENGVLKEHMQSRETASIFGVEPNSSMRASKYSFMPLIRMSCTGIEPGDWEPEEMVKDVKSGYMILDMKVPSIDMMRYNWSISCQYAQKIENGELCELLRDVIVFGTSPEFFNSIDARGKDFTVRPIINCGKGDPMQIMRMGNGGPHIRGVATVKSVVS